MKIINLVRQVAIASATSTLTTLTVVTTVNHNLVTGNFVAFDTNVKRKYTVTVTNATTFTVPVIITSVSSEPFIPVGFVYPTSLNASGLISVSTPVGSTDGSLTTFQAIGSTSTGTGAATVNIEVSNNGVNWLTYGTITLTLGITESTDGLVLAAPWAFVRANASSITGTTGNIVILMGRNS